MSQVKINDRVTTRRIGQPIVATVCGAVDAKVFAECWNAGADFSEYDLHYPCWRNWMVILVKLDEPLRCDDCETETWILGFPEEDVEVFDDSFVENMSKNLMARAT